MRVIIQNELSLFMQGLLTIFHCYVRAISSMTLPAFRKNLPQSCKPSLVRKPLIASWKEYGRDQAHGEIKHGNATEGNEDTQYG